MTLPVADGPWWTRKNLSDGITRFEEPFVDPLLQPNSWLVEGRDRNLLVDSGMGIVSLKDELGPLMDKPLLAVASHTHFDHVGSLHEFAERACHISETDVLAEPNGHNTVADIMDSLEITALPYEGYDTESYHIKAAPVTRALDEGDVIDLGDRVFKVLHLPGHSRGSIGLLEEATGIFFSGDVVFEGEILDELFSLEHRGLRRDHAPLGGAARERRSPRPLRQFRAGALGRAREHLCREQAGSGLPGGSR